MLSASTHFTPMPRRYSIFASIRKCYSRRMTEKPSVIPLRRYVLSEFFYPSTCRQGCPSGCRPLPARAMYFSGLTAPCTPSARKTTVRTTLGTRSRRKRVSYLACAVNVFFYFLFCKSCQKRKKECSSTQFFSKQFRLLVCFCRPKLTHDFAISADHSDFEFFICS